MAVKTTSGIALDSSPTYKWGVMVIVGNRWSTVGFFKTEKAAKRHALELGAVADPVLIARRFDRRELRGSRGVA